MNGELSSNAPGLVAVMNNRTDLERAQAEHWYRIPVQSAPDGVRDIRWIALFAKLKAHPHYDVYLAAARPEGVPEPAGNWELRIAVSDSRILLARRGSCRGAGDHTTDPRRNRACRRARASAGPVNMSSPI